MMHHHEHPAVLWVSARTHLDDRESLRLIEEVRERATLHTAMIVVSLAATTKINWNALCRLRHAAQSWRAPNRSVVVEPARPSQRSLLASAGVFG
ncbi:MAG: hypothetical protein ACREM2_06030 [Vulcanimicrobiaceae bacterium]